MQFFFNFMKLPCHVADGEEQVLLDGDGYIHKNKERRGMARDPAIVSRLGDEEALLYSGHPVLSLSPPHSPRWLDTDEQAPILEAAEASDHTVFSDYVSFAGEFKIPELEPEARASDIPIDYIPLQKLKDRLISDEDDYGVQSLEPSLVLSCTVGYYFQKTTYLKFGGVCTGFPGL